jgi:hypothetical protein
MHMAIIVLMLAPRVANAASFQVILGLPNDREEKRHDHADAQ